MTRRVVEVAPARLDGWLERFPANNPDGPQRVAGVERFDHDPLAVVLVRRGGYAVGVASGDRLTAHKVGTRYVQSRTAAGGWSQQRFARRRANQADGLVGAAAEHAVRLLTGIRPAGVVLGGDKALVGDAARGARGWPASATCRAASSTTCPTRAVDVPRAGACATAGSGAVRVTIEESAAVSATPVRQGRPSSDARREGVS